MPAKPFRVDGRDLVPQEAEEAVPADQAAGAKIPESWGRLQLAEINGPRADYQPHTGSPRTGYGVARERFPGLDDSGRPALDPKPIPSCLHCRQRRAGRVVVQGTAGWYRACAGARLLLAVPPFPEAPERPRHPDRSRVGQLLFWGRLMLANTIEEQGLGPEIGLPDGGPGRPPGPLPNARFGHFGNAGHPADRNCQITRWLLT